MKTFVLRTEAVLSSSNSTLRFGEDNTIVIPTAILQNLYRYKGFDEKRNLANQFVEYIDEIPQSELMSKKGFKQKNGSYLRVVDNSEVNSEISSLVDFSRLDQRVFQVCKDLQKEENNEIILISKNPNIRLKAYQLGIKAEIFKDELFPSPKDQYTGICDVYVEGSVVEEIHEKNEIEIQRIFNFKSIEWVENKFVVLKSVDSNTLARYTNGKLVLLEYQRKIPEKWKALNVEQRMFWEALLTPAEKAPLVIAKGVAGTGKTYCSLAMALENLAGYDKNSDNEPYKQILVASPTVTISNESIGYLPGNVDEKVGPYLGGIMDNLKEILRPKFPKASNADLKGKAQNLFDKGLIEIQPIGFLRGRTIPNTVFIIDETQNIAPRDIKDIVTRSAKGSKFIFLGDPTQVNNPELNSRYNGLVYLSERMKGNERTYQITLNSKKSVRGELAQDALLLL